MNSKGCAAIRTNSSVLLVLALGAGLLAGCGPNAKPRPRPAAIVPASRYPGDRLSQSVGHRLQSLLPHAEVVVHVTCTQSSSAGNVYFCYVLTNRHTYAYAAIVEGASRYRALPSAGDLARRAPPPRFSGSF